MLSLQLCLSIAPLLAGSDARHDSFPPVSLTIPYHLIAHTDGQLPATPVVLITDDDDDEDDDDDDKDRDERREELTRRDRDDRRDGEDRKPESRPAEGRRPQPEGLRDRIEMHRPDGPGHPPKDGDHRPQPDHKQQPHQGPSQHDKSHAPQPTPAASGGFRPPVMGMPHFGGMFGHGSPFGGGPGKPQAQPAGHGHESSVLTGIIFELLDQNHDGNLSRGEFQKLADAVQKSHHPPMMMPTHFGPGEGPNPNLGRPQLSRRNGPPMIHQPMPPHQAHKPDGDHKPEGNPRPDGEHDRKPEHSDQDGHRERGERDSFRPRPDGERGAKSREHQEPRI